MRNVEILATVADCDAALADAGQMKSSFQIRMASLQFALEDHAAITAQLPLDLQEEQQRIAVNQNILTSMSSVKFREELERQINMAENEIRNLQIRIERYNPSNFVRKSRDMAVAQLQLATMEEVIAELQARKASLQSQSAA